MNTYIVADYTGDACSPFKFESHLHAAAAFWSDSARKVAHDEVQEVAEGGEACCVACVESGVRAWFSRTA